MTYFIKGKEVFTSKPVERVDIDLSHPLARGLINLALPGINNDPASNNLATLGSDFSLVSTYHGLAADCTALGTIEEPGMFFPASVASSLANELTLHFVFIPNFSSSTTNTGAIANTLLDTTSGNTEGFRVFNVSSTQWRFRLFTSSATNLDVNKQSFSSGDLVTLTCRYDGSNMQIYQDGEYVGGTSKTGSIDPVIDGVNWFDVITNSLTGRENDEVADAKVLFGGMWNRALSGEEIARLNSNPYAFLKPANDYLIPISTGAASGVSVSPIADTLVISEGTLTITAEQESRITPVADTLIISEGTLTIDQPINVDVTPIADTLVISEGTLTVVAETETRVTPVADDLVITEGTLSVVQAGPVDVTPIADELIISEGQLSITHQVETETYTGGFTGDWYQAWQPTKEEIKKQRIELGIIKPEIDQITRVVKKVQKGQIKPEQAATEAKQYFKQRNLVYQPTHEQAINSLVKFLQDQQTYNPVEYAAQRAAQARQAEIEQQEYNELVELLKAEQQRIEDQDIVFVMMCLAA